jgi:hypothetical protein
MLLAAAWAGWPGAYCWPPPLTGHVQAILINPSASPWGKTPGKGAIRRGPVASRGWTGGAGGSGSMVAVVLFLRERKRYDAGNKRQNMIWQVHIEETIQRRQPDIHVITFTSKYKSREKDKGAKRSIQIKIHAFS